MKETAQARLRCLSVSQELCSVQSYRNERSWLIKGSLEFKANFLNGGNKRFIFADALT